MAAAAIPPTATSVTATPSAAAIPPGSAGAGTDVDWDLVHENIAGKLDLLVGPAADAAGGHGTAAIGEANAKAGTGKKAGGKKAGGKRAGGKATQGGRVTKGNPNAINERLPEKSMKFVRALVHDYPNDGTFRKLSGKWHIRRDAWPAFVGFIRSRADLSRDNQGMISLEKKEIPQASGPPGPATSFGPVLPSSTVALPSETCLSGGGLLSGGGPSSGPSSA